MKKFSILLIGLIGFGIIGCAKTEVTSDDAAKFGKESEDDKKAKAAGEEVPAQPDR